MLLLYIDVAVDGTSELAHTLARVLQKYDAKLIGCLKPITLQKFADSLHSADIITDDLHDKPVYTEIQQEFAVCLECLSEKQEFEDHCRLFVGSLRTLGGPLKRVADTLNNDWKVTVKTELLIDLDLP